MQLALVALAVMRFGLRLELAPEYDSNVDRVEQGPASTAGAPASGTGASSQQAPAPVGSFLLQSTARSTLTLAAGANALRLGLDVGGKWFFESDARQQDEVVLRAALDARHRFDRGVTLALAGEYWDAFQWNDCPPLTPTDPTGVPETWCHRDFRQAGARLVASWARGVPAIAAEVGARGYQWKPDADLSFLGVGAAVTPSARFRQRDRDGEDDTEWTLSSTGRIEQRFYEGPALRSIDDLGDARLPSRRDLVATWSASVSYVGRALWSLGYLVECDRSSSAGESFLYEALTMSLTMPLGRRFTAAGRAQLLFFSSGAGQALYGEDENRDALTIDLAREMGAGFTLAARYSVFANAAGSTREYLRQLVSLGVTWSR